MSAAWQVVRRFAGHGLVLLAIACTTPRETSPRVVQQWVTTADRRLLLARQPDLVADVAGAPDAAGRVGEYLLRVETTTRFQTLTGFGAALTDASAQLLMALPAGDRQRLLTELFSPTDGLGLSMTRITLGASDFSSRHYTLNDAPPGLVDSGLTRFSLAPMQQAVIPIVRAARVINPQLTVMATPWSAPAWMKSNGSLMGGTLRAEAYPWYAAYLTRSIVGLRNEGVPVALLSVQNEPHHEPRDYPGMRLSPAQRAHLVGRWLGPALRQARLETAILEWDHNWDEPASPLAVLADSAARAHLAGVAWHCYAGQVGAQSVVHDAYPTLDTYFTECAGGDWAPEWGDNLLWNAQTLVVGSLQHWARGVTLWNLALDPDHGPHTGGCTDCRGVVTIDPPARTIVRNPEYYALAHASRFVRPGAQRVAIRMAQAPAAGLADTVQSVAARNADGSVAVIIVYLGGETGVAVGVQVEGRRVHTVLSPRSVTTLRWPALPLPAPRR